LASVVSARLRSKVAKAAGVCVFAVEVSAAKEAWACEIGADETLNQSRVDIPATVRELTNGSGVGCVINIVGQSATNNRRWDQRVTPRWPPVPG